MEGRLLEWLAEAYVRNGDIFSQLYTCTPALATGIRQHTSAYVSIRTQRRYLLATLYVHACLYEQAHKVCNIFSQLYTCMHALDTGAIREYTSLPPAQSDADVC